MPDTTIQLQPQGATIDESRFAPFYELVRRATGSLGYRNYARFAALLMTGREADIDAQFGISTDALDDLPPGDPCYSSTRAYERLHEATQLFVASQASLLEDCCPPRDGDLGRLAVAAPADLAGGIFDLTELEVQNIRNRFSSPDYPRANIISLANRLVEPPESGPGGVGGECDDLPPVGAAQVDALAGGRRRRAARAGRDQSGLRDRIADQPDLRMANVLTFMQQLRDNQAGVPLKDCALGSGNCYGLLVCKLQCPPMVELIWSYWMEQGMLVQGLNAMTMRFQNRRPIGRDPLTRFDLSPLRPLNNILWSYIQKEPDRLSVVRRAYEYDHHYGLRLNGRAIPQLAPADSRSQFLEAFHRLLGEAARYYRFSMDTTMQADAYPVMNSLKELHLILAEGAHNQFGDLPTTARAEMLMQQWILARPEIQMYLGGRPGVPYPEAWMPHAETLRQMFGWADASIRHYRDLAVFGEQLLLAIRYLPWSLVNDSKVAAGWLTFWRPEVQAYLHSYRAVTGVDLSPDDVRVTPGSVTAVQPSDLIRRRRAAMRV